MIVHMDGDVESILPVFCHMANENRSEWDFYTTLEEMLKCVNEGDAVFSASPSKYNPETLALLVIEKFSTGNVQINVLWSGGSRDAARVADCVSDAEALAKDVEAQRIRFLACKSMAKALKENDFYSAAIELRKDL